MLALITSLQQRVADRFATQDRGATAVEYGLLVGLIAVVIIAAVMALGGTLNDLFTSVESALPGTSTSTSTTTTTT